MTAGTPLDPDLEVIRDLKQFGASAGRTCAQCATCSVVCELSTDREPFPRRQMLWAQWGLADRLRSSLDPWLCYYCGNCSDRCPRKAEPGETMMSLRRWLTSQYDFTGLSRLFYRSAGAEILALLSLAVLTAVGFLAFGFSQGDINAYDGPDAFLPSSAVHVFDWSMAGVLTFFLMVNAARMWWFSIGSDKAIKVPFSAYVKNLHVLPLHFVTQKRYAQCGKSTWAIHLALMSSYVTMLVLIMFFLKHVQAGPEIDWSVHAFGYAASFGLVATVAYALQGRLRKTRAPFKHSHDSDWIFLTMLAIVTLTGIAQHVLHRTGEGLAANIAYVVHLSFVVPMLVLEVPFSKWSHMLYRPLAVYLAQVRRDVVAEAASAAAPASAQTLPQTTS
jgi:quinone-modifying oxidoreductase, subunit QmoC